MMPHHLKCPESDPKTAPVHLSGHDISPFAPRPPAYIPAVQHYPLGPPNTRYWALEHPEGVTYAQDGDSAGVKRVWAPGLEGKGRSEG